MPHPSLAAIAAKLAAIEIAMLSTRTEGGHIAARPMSNNGEVEYDGDSFYFTDERSRTVADIGRDPRVALAFTGDDGFWANVSGEAELIRDKAQFEAHWTPDIDRWFKDGVDTEGLVLVKVGARRIKWWDGEKDAEIVL